MKAVYEKVRSKDEAALIAFTYEGETFDAPWHYHPEYELTLIIEGTGMRYVGNNVSAFSSGDMVLLGEGLPHCWRNGEKLGAKSIVIQWNSTILPDIPEFANIKHTLTIAQRGIKYTEDLSNAFMTIVNAADPMIRYSHFINLLHLISTLQNFELLAGPSYQIDTSTKTSNRLDLIHQYLAQHFHEKITLSQMSNLLNMTNESFSRFFSKRMQKPFFSFLNEYRINRAGRMLIETDKQVSEIAYLCGYESLPFFFKQFTRYKNCSPKSFRKQYRKQVLP